MAKAIFVHLSDTFLQLSEAARSDRHCAALKHVTCGWWRAAPAEPVAYAFGVHGGKVVSGYRVETPPSDWPQLPAPMPDEGRRYIPGLPLTEEAWSRLAGAPVDITGQNPVLYGHVAEDGSFAITFGGT